jgi:hypothetical protein
VDRSRWKRNPVGGAVIDEELTARLLRLGGMRPDVPQERERRVRDAFLGEVRARARARVVRRRMMAAAAVLAIAAAGVVASRFGIARGVATPALVVATVERLEGEGIRQNGSSAPVRIALGDPVHAGDGVESGAAGRIGLRLTSGASLRFDHRSRVRLVSPSRIALEAGGLYVDSGPRSPGLEIATSFGLVRNIGTQFELRLDDASLRVRVRSGVVEVHRGAEVSSVRPGAELIVTAAQVTSRPVVPYGPDWAWMASLGTGFEIEGRPLSAFLEYICREQGWTLTYGDSALALEASGIILHGSTHGLPPSEALAIVLATTGLTHRVTDGELAVSRAPRP